MAVRGFRDRQPIRRDQSNSIGGLAMRRIRHRQRVSLRQIKCIDALTVRGVLHHQQNRAHHCRPDRRAQSCA